MLYNMNSLRLLNVNLNRCIYKIQFPKFISSHHMKYIEIQEKWRKKDDVSKRWELIYKAPMEGTINWATTYVTATTGLFVLAGIYYIVSADDRPDPHQPIFLGGSDIILAENLQECLIYIGAYVAFHIAIKILMSKYVLRLYKDGDRYLAIYRGHIYNSIKKHEFNLKDCKKLNPTYVVPWGDSRFSLGSRQGILMERHFKTPEYLNRLIYKDKNYEN